MAEPRSFDDLSPDERLEWAERDPAGYDAAVRALAYEVAEAGFKSRMRRRQADDWRRPTAPFRWLREQMRSWRSRPAPPVPERDQCSFCDQRCVMRSRPVASIHPGEETRHCIDHPPPGVDTTTPCGVCGQPFWPDLLHLDCG
jgi:hypothetical protein